MVAYGQSVSSTIHLLIFCMQIFIQFTMMVLFRTTTMALTIATSGLDPSLAINWFIQGSFFKLEEKTDYNCKSLDEKTDYNCKSLQEEKTVYYDGTIVAHKTCDIGTL
jgi:hypothetical protein